MFTMLISTLLFTQSSATFDHTCETRDYGSSHLWHWRRSLVTHVILVITAHQTCDIGDDSSSHLWDSWLRLVTPVTLATIGRHTCETRDYGSSHLWHWWQSLVTPVRLVSWCQVVHAAVGCAAGSYWNARSSRCAAISANGLWRHRRLLPVSQPPVQFGSVYAAAATTRCSK